MSLLDLRRRIKSVKNTQKITRAMQMIAASKMRRAVENAQRGREYAEEMTQIVENLVLHAGSECDENPLFRRAKEVKNIAYIIITADRGLCGGFNSNLIRYTVKLPLGPNQSRSLICVGRKAMQFFKRFAGGQVVAEFDNIGDRPNYLAAAGVLRVALDGFLAGEFDEVRVVYNHFVSTLSQEPREALLLPFTAPVHTAAQQKAAAKMEYLFEPSAAEVLTRVLPRYLETRVFQALLESSASEHSARMLAMQNATDNAKELGRSLTLEMNKMRQTKITTEISEIVGGAAALAA